MSFEEFAEKLQADLAHRLEGQAEVTRVSFLHNNGMESPSLCVHIFGRNAAPGLNLKNLYAYYCHGTDWHTLVAEALKMIQSETDFEFLQSDSFLWENIRGRIRPVLVCLAQNRRRMQECPHRTFLDLLLLYSIFWKEMNGMEAFAIIRTGNMESWGITEEELYRTAMENSLREDEFLFRSMEDITKDLFREENVPGDSLPDEMGEAADESRRIPLYVLTSSSRRWGARVLLFPEWISAQCQLRNWKSVYVLPSSVHEVIVLRTELAPAPEELKALISTVNKECLEEEDVLSDSLYVLDVKNSDLRIWECS